MDWEHEKRSDGGVGELGSDEDTIIRGLHQQCRGQCYKEHVRREEAGIDVKYAVQYIFWLGNESA